VSPEYQKKGAPTENISVTFTPLIDKSDWKWFGIEYNRDFVESQTSKYCQIVSGITRFGSSIR
jgi:hypothetical protein